MTKILILDPCKSCMGDFASAIPRRYLTITASRANLNKPDAWEVGDGTILEPPIAHPIPVKGARFEGLRSASHARVKALRLVRPIPDHHGAPTALSASCQAFVRETDAHGAAVFIVQHDRKAAAGSAETKKRRVARSVGDRAGTP